MSTKLPKSGAAALELPFAEPTHYGLGKSYRAIAPKRVVAGLDLAAERPAAASSRKRIPTSRGTTARGAVADAAKRPRRSR